MVPSLVLIMCLTSAALADAVEQPDISPKRRAAAIALSIVPGILVRGTGSYIARDPRTGRRLLFTSGIAAGTLVVGAVGSGGTGGNPKLIVPFVPMVVAGAGVLVQTWLADIYRAAGADTGSPRAHTPWSFELGSTYTHDAYRNRALLRGAVRFGYHRFEVGAGGYLHAGGDTRAADVDVNVRILGADPTGGVIADGSWLGVRATGRFRSDDDDRVRVLTAEIELIGRLDLERIESTLHGSFAELSTGVGVDRAAFTGAHETGGLLLGRFAWGMYLRERGEAKLFYDHRRDSLAGGIAASRAAGFVGSVGAEAQLRVVGRWAVRGELEVGSAWVATLALRFQGGPP